MDTITSAKLSSGYTGFYSFNLYAVYRMDLLTIHCRLFFTNYVSAISMFTVCTSLSDNNGPRNIAMSVLMYCCPTGLIYLNLIELEDVVKN